MSGIHNFKSILVLRGGALGDFVLTLPVLAALRGAYPTVRLEILGYPSIATLAQAAGMVDSVQAIEAPAFARLFAADAPAHPWFASFDLIVSYIYDGEGIFHTNLRHSAPRALILQGPHRPDESADVHATDALLEPLRQVGIVGVDPEPRLRLSEPPAQPNRLALHPGSGSARKNWPERNWSALLQLILGETSWNCLLIGGEAEGDRLIRLAPRTSPRISVAQNLPLLEVARLMQSCAAFLGHDSGITHLAAALGLPGIALWGETKQSVWHPRSPKFKVILHPGGLSALPAEEVLRQLLDSGMLPSDPPAHEYGH